MQKIDYFLRGILVLSYSELMKLERSNSRPHRLAEMLQFGICTKDNVEQIPCLLQAGDQKRIGMTGIGKEGHYQANRVLDYPGLNSYIMPSQPQQFFSIEGDSVSIGGDGGLLCRTVFRPSFDPPE